MPASREYSQRLNENNAAVNSEDDANIKPIERYSK
jgi:hypothetical protein